MINKLLLSLYDYYRKKNGSTPAVFHSKVLLGVFILMITLIILLGGFALFGNRVEGQINGDSSKLVLIGVLILVVSLLWFLTDSDKVLESKRDYAEVSYRRYFFVTFYLSIPILIYLIATIPN